MRYKLSTRVGEGSPARCHGPRFERLKVMQVDDPPAATAWACVVGVLSRFPLAFADGGRGRALTPTARFLFPHVACGPTPPSSASPRIPRAHPPPPQTASSFPHPPHHHRWASPTMTAAGPVVGAAPLVLPTPPVPPPPSNDPPLPPIALHGWFIGLTPGGRLALWGYRDDAAPPPPPPPQRRLHHHPPVWRGAPPLRPCRPTVAT